MISCRARLVTVDETWLYLNDPDIKKNQWSDGIAAQPAPTPPKKSDCKIFLESFSPWIFGIKTTSSSLIIFQRAKLSTGSITQPCWCKWRKFWRKNFAGISPRSSCSCSKILRIIGHLQPRRNWPTWASSISITHPILQIWPRLSNTCSLDWKTIEKTKFSVRRKGHCCGGNLIGRTSFWNSLCDLKKLKQRAMKYIKLRGEYVE